MKRQSIPCRPRRSALDRRTDRLLARWQVFLLVIGLAIPIVAQTPDRDVSARDLYLDSAPEMERPPRSAGSDPSISERDLKLSKSPARDDQFLAIRYNILLSTDSGGPLQPVDPQRVFRTGECVSLEVQVNREGYLYILAQGASSAWTPLVPSVLVPGEANAVEPHVTMQVPLDDCIEFIDPPGTESLFVILLSESADVQQLQGLFQGSSIARSNPDSGTSQVGGEDIRKAQSQLASRDLRLKKIAQPKSPGERPFMVYAAAMSRLFIEIPLRHE